MHYIIPHFEQNLSSLAPEQSHTEQNILVNVLLLSTNKHWATRMAQETALQEWRECAGSPTTSYTMIIN